MTLQEFLDRLQATPRNWYSDDGILRLRDNDDCPITVVHGKGLEVNEFKEAAEELGLSASLALAIVDAADLNEGHDPILRLQLLAACGITPEELEESLEPQALEPVL